MTTTFATPQHRGFIAVTILSLLILIGLALIAQRHSVRPTQLRDIKFSPSLYNNQRVVLEGYVRNYYDAGDPSNNSFDFLSGDYLIPVKSGFIEVPPKNTKINIVGTYQIARSNPYVSEHIRLNAILLPDSKWWFDALDERTRYKR